MGPISRMRGGQRQQELDSSKYLSLLNSVPDENTMGKLQDALETSSSERSHPMIMALSKQKDQLQRANNVIGHEMELRRSKRSSSKTDFDEKPSRKRGRSRSRVDVEPNEPEVPAAPEPPTEVSTEPEVQPAEEEKSVATETHPSIENEETGSTASQVGDSESVTEEAKEENNGDEDTKSHDPDAMEDDAVVDEVTEKSQEAPDDDASNPAAGEPQETTLSAPDSAPPPETSALDSASASEPAPAPAPEPASTASTSASGPTSTPTPATEEEEEEEEEAAAAAETTAAVLPPPSSSDAPAEHTEETSSDKNTGEPDARHKNTSEKALAGSSTENMPGNNKFVANPKSEYVATQSLPVHTFSVFKEGDEENEDEEAYKRRSGVVSYPKEDSSTLTAGPVPMEDYTRAKPSNQVQFSTYATFLEPYFRPFTEEDIQFLQQPAVGAGVEAVNLKTGKKMSPYVFPPLGPHYHQNWAIQDAELSGQEVSTSIRKANEAQTAEIRKIYDPTGTASDLTDSNLEASAANVSLGPFTERLIAAVISEASDSSETDNNHHSHNGSAGTDGVPASPSAVVEKTVAAIPPPPQNTSPVTDFAELEERIKNEFRYVGVLDMGSSRQFEQHKSEFKLAAPQVRDEFSDPTVMDVDWINGSEDDEISRVLRYLQARLKEVSRRNAMYKSQLLPVIQEQSSWQEYQSILQDLDKQVDQAYMKRQKAPQVNKQKKKKASTAGIDSPYDSNVATPQSSVPFTPDSSKSAADQKPSIKASIDKRERWISKIGPSFKPAHEMMREYETPKFVSVDEEDDDDEDEDRDE